jgi:hypothetical protein
MWGWTSCCGGQRSYVHKIVELDGDLALEVLLYIARVRRMLSTTGSTSLTFVEQSDHLDLSKTSKLSQPLGLD